MEREARRIEAERVRLLSDALELAGIESESAREPLAALPELHAPNNTRGELALRAIRAEIATALRLSERTVDRQLSQAYTLSRSYPSVLSALAVGALSPRHASVIVDAGSVIGARPDATSLVNRGEYTAAAIAAAADRTPAGLSAHAKRLAERYADVPLDERHADARRQRRVWVEDREDGMADLCAHLPATEAYAIKHRLTHAARSIAEQEQPRSRNEIEADIFADLLLTRTLSDDGASASPRDTSGTGTRSFGPQAAGDGSPNTASPGAVGRATSNSGMRALVHVIVPQATISDSLRAEARESNELPELVGYGPIDHASARRLLGHAPAWNLVRTSAEAGAILSIDRYRPSEQMRRLLRARDEHCRFPGCRVPVDRCDIDHTVDAAHGGETTTANLAHLCRGHHTLKHQTGWRVKQRAPGVLTWTSPSGRRYTDRPESQVRFS